MSELDQTQTHILLSVDKKVDKLMEDVAVVKAGAEATAATLRDHESRIRPLEQWRAEVDGGSQAQSKISDRAIAFLAMFVGLFGAVLSALAYHFL